jgi:tripeptide aminopeptidase
MEEVGRGADHFDVEGFGPPRPTPWTAVMLASWSTRTLNAASATVTVHGLNIHPGSAKNKMKNAP